MTTAAWITLATALLTLFLLVKTRIKMDAVFIMCMAILLFTGVLSEEQTFRGFVSRGALVIVFLGFVVAAMANTGALHWLSRQLLGKYVSMPRSLLRVTSLTALLSGFFPNVALGNIMYGSVNEWTHKNHIASSRLLLPVAYAVSFGSAMTVIGNSSNLIWSEMYTSITGNDMPFFAPLAACLACMVAGLVAIQLFRDRLTDHLNSEELADTFRDYCVELIVPSDSPLWGKTLSEAGIFAGEDFYLVKIQAFDNEVKEEDHIHPDIQVMGGDRLVFAGKLDAIRRIQQKWKLVVENDLNSKSSVLKKLTTHYQVAAIAPKSYLIGCRLSETQFEQRYSVTGIAICRNGVFLGESIREVELQEGDMMVLHGAKLPWHRLTNVVISQTSSDVYSYDWHTIASSLILLAIILTSVFNLMPLMRAAFLGAIVTSLMGNFQNKNRWSGINWTLVTVIAGSQALGEAVHTSGLSDVASHPGALRQHRCGAHATHCPRYGRRSGLQSATLRRGCHAGRCLQFLHPVLHRPHHQCHGARPVLPQRALALRLALCPHHVCRHRPLRHLVLSLPLSERGLIVLLTMRRCFIRLRPYVRYNEPTLIPKDEDLLRDNGSYPSGHSIRGWAMKSSWPTSLLPVPNMRNWQRGAQG